MSKSKTKKARREAKRTHKQKTTSHPRKITKNAKPQPAKSTLQSAAQKSKSSNAQAHEKKDIPFGPYDNILLVGEGDFSFTNSLVTHHGCASVTATSFDSEEEVLKKYPTASPIITSLSSLEPPVPFHHAIDATKLQTYKPLRQLSPFTHICFNFPHTGGLSTDVNRQVRSNQSLLVNFFQSSLPLLSPGGRVLVTLFEGEPYTLWNIRDLARHAGLAVVESFRFDWGLYSGYTHVRTLGMLEGGGAWRGEQRQARTYVFEKPEGEGDGAGQNNRGGKKRKKDDSDSEDD